MSKRISVFLIIFAFLIGFSSASIEVQAKQERVISSSKVAKLTSFANLKKKHIGKTKADLTNADVFEYVKELMANDFGLK